MKTYARIQDGRVAELVTTAADLASLYHPSLLWVDASAIPGITIGWEFDGSRFLAPQPQQTKPATLSIEELQARLALLSAQITAMRRPA